MVADTTLATHKEYRHIRQFAHHHCVVSRAAGEIVNRHANLLDSTREQSLKMLRTLNSNMFLHTLPIERDATPRTDRTDPLIEGMARLFTQRIIWMTYI